MSLKSGVAKFNNLIDKLKETFRAHIKVFTEGSSSEDYPDSLGAKGMSQEDIKDSFSRQEIDEEYIDSLKGPANKKIGLFNQNEILAAAHKATTLRYRSRIDMFMIACYREHGQVQSRGYVSLAVQQSSLTGNEKD